MSQTYVPLYRKYRPQTFADLIGQEHITTALSNAIQLNKVAHAYLFCGPRGTGKTSSARIFAKSLNCVNGPTVEPCGQCPSCVDITNTTPVDVVEIDAASNRSVEDAQNILEKIQYVPIHGKYKIYIIDEVHMLSTTAFNALLKTLEEPPENVIFILATTEAHKVLETIVSRCQRFDFRRITVDDIVKRLEFIAEKENINISKEALFAIAKSAQGGMRDALALLDQLSILDVQKQIDVEDVENLLGKISVKVLFDLTEKIISNSPQEAVLEINKIYAKGNEPLQILSNLIEYFRNLLIIKTCEDKETILNLTQLNEDMVSLLAPQAKALDSNVINYVIDRLAAYLREIKSSANRYLWLEVGIIELANKLSNVGFSDLVARIEELEKTINGGIQPISRPATTPISRPVAPIQPQKPQILEQTVRAEVQNTTETQAEITAEPKNSEEEISETENLSSAHTLPEIQAEREIPATNPQENNPRVDLWDILLSKFTSLPSKMFFTNLSTPILISENKVVIGFVKENFVKQSKESSKMTQLKSAVEALFGNSNMPIEIKLITEEEAEAAKKKTNTVTAPKTLQPTTPPPSQTRQKADDENDDEEYYEQQLEQSKPQAAPNHSDQAEMILDLFNGKYMD